MRSTASLRIPFNIGHRAGGQSATLEARDSARPPSRTGPRPAARPAEADPPSLCARTPAGRPGTGPVRPGAAWPETGSTPVGPATGQNTSQMIDRMRHWSIVGSVGPLRGPGRQRPHASAGQPGSTEGEDQLEPTTSHLGPCRRRTFRRTRRTNQMCSTSSLRLRRRHHRLPVIHRRLTRTAGPRPFGGAGL